VTDRHVRILAKVARHSQSRLDEHDDDDRAQDPASAERRHNLTIVAARTRARVAAAQARRQRA
jgi:hypothetical protein